jgi:formamidopyrimidine-DNA glycosylase
MPELPEIETLKLSLEKHIVNRIITAIDIGRPNLRYPLKENLKPQIISSKIVKLRRLAKYLLLELDNDNCIIVHLGMSGRFTLQPSSYQFRKHDHIIFQLNTNQYLVFNDARRFGMIETVSTSNLQGHKFFKDLGVEPLTDEFNAQYLFSKIQYRKMPIKNILMDSKIVVGIGNIYASESLFLAGLTPERSGNGLSLQETIRLITSIKQVLEQAISEGGTTLKDFISGDSKPGYFKQKLTVYGRAGKNCIICKDIIVKIKQAGRASFYCPTCQK